MVGLLPLVHLNFALKTIAVLGDDSEVAIAQIGAVAGRA